jgi:hypothetical protein
MLSPSDAAAFFSAGTNCASYASSSSKTTTDGNTKLTLFGYTFTFGIRDAVSGKIISESSV